MIESKFGLNFNYSIHSTAKNTRMTYESSMKNTLNQNELINYENENLKFKIIELEEALEKVNFLNKLKGKIQVSRKNSK